MAFDYDMIVIGGGAAGLVASGMAALLGAKTALIEEHRLGGDCTWTGCVPSKTLLRAARVAHQTHIADRYGLLSSSPRIDFGSVMNHVRKIREHVYEEADAPPNLETLGVTVIPARARFIDPHTVELRTRQSQNSRLSARYFGLIKVLASSSGRILGASILGENAGEMIGEWAVAMRNGLKLRNVADTIHPYPTYSLGNRRAADQWYTKQLNSPLIDIMAKLFRYRGERRRNVEI